MNDDTKDPGGEIPADQIDTGEPIAELADFEVPASLGFFGRLRRAIERRFLTSDLAELSWSGPIMVVMEWISVVFGFLAGPGRDAKERTK